MLSFPANRRFEISREDVQDRYNRERNGPFHSGLSSPRYMDDMSPLFPVALWEDLTGYHLELDVPGMVKEDIDLTLTGNVFRISGSRKLSEDRKYHLNQCHYGQFERVINLPENIDDKAIHAELNQGVLHIHLKKSPDSQPREISVHEG